jgi:transcriptional regulator with XRE-family HTH domain
MTLSEILKGAVRNSGRTPFDVSKAAGIAPSQLSRFLRGERSLTLTSAEKLHEALGLKTIEGPRRGGARKVS